MSTTAGALPSSIELVLDPPTRDLGDGFTVRRALPSAHRRMVGPFIFFDQMGPVLLRAGVGLDVRPHPHIGLATVTYLFEGTVIHRDSLGVVQSIRPGEVNWMTAGRGIVHSERTPPEDRESDSTLSGIQIWVALPKKDEEREPTFAHHAAEALPQLDGEGRRVRLILGELFGARSPVETFSRMIYADVKLEPGAQVEFTAELEERAVYVVDGDARIDGAVIERGKLAVLTPGTAVRIFAAEGAPARVMLLGGDRLDGKRHIFWNFVSSSHERLEQAKDDWRQGRFPPVPGETEFIPLPESGPANVRYP